MRQLPYTLTKKTALTPFLWQLDFAVPETIAPPQPGQFYLAECADPLTAYLRRTLFPRPTESDSAGVSALQVVLSVGQASDPGLAWLLSRAEGQSVDLLGPLGQGFSLSEYAKNLLLIGLVSSEGPILPLLTLAEQAIARQMNVVLVLEATSERNLYPATSLPPAVELRLITHDGSRGQRGRLLNQDSQLSELIRWADQVCLVGQRDSLRQFQQKVQDTRPILPPDFAQALPSDVALNLCGVGTCTFCAIPTKKGHRLPCSDGPVFDLGVLG